MRRSHRSDRCTRTRSLWAPAFFALCLAALGAGCQDARTPTAPADLVADPTAYALDGVDIKGVGTFKVSSSGHVVLRTPSIAFDFHARLEAPHGPSIPAIVRDQLVNTTTPPVSLRRASGVMQFSFADGSVIRYMAVHSEVGGNASPAGPLTFLLLPYLESGEIDFMRPAIAIARQSPGNNDYLLWDIEGSTIHDASIEFEVPGEIALAPHDVQPPALPWFGISYPPQPIVVRETGEAGAFSARAIVGGDLSADGLVELEVPIGKGPVRLDTVFGMPMPGTQTGPGFIILLVVDGAPLLLENVETATVRPNPRIPGCDIWDFQSNGVSFDARGRQFLLPTANARPRHWVFFGADPTGHPGGNR